jgi:thioredoxin reductase
LLEARGVIVREEQIVRFEGPGTSLEHLALADGRTAACQALFCRAPTRQRARLATALGCRLFDDDAVEVNELAQTTQPGVYAVGDMARTAATPSVVHQVVKAAAQGVAAATAIDQELLRDSSQD